MAEDKSEEVYNALATRLQSLREKEELNFQGKMKDDVETYTEILKTKSDETMDDKMTEFAENLDKQAEDIFAAKAKEVWIKVNLSALLTPKSESADFLRSRTGTTETIAQVEYNARSEEIEVKDESPAEVLKVEGGIQKKLSLVLTQCVNVVSVFVGVSAILYAATTPCAMVNRFHYLIIAGCIGMGVFGVLGFLEVWDVVGEIKDWAKRNESLESTEGPKLKSVLCYIGLVLLKLSILIGFSLFLTILLGLLVDNKSCAEREEPPVGHWDH